jgi:diphthamide synthase (EF-2-diphthine--ammonia ligase)
MRAIFPIWGRNTAELARTVIALGFKSFLSSVAAAVGPGFAGRLFDEEFLRALPPGIDPCGENGEFHSFVCEGPIFERSIPIRVGETVDREGRFFADLMLDPGGTMRCSN